MSKNNEHIMLMEMYKHKAEILGDVEKIIKYNLEFNKSKIEELKKYVYDLNNKDLEECVNRLEKRNEEIFNGEKDKIITKQDNLLKEVIDINKKISEIETSIGKRITNIDKKITNVYNSFSLNRKNVDEDIIDIYNKIKEIISDVETLKVEELLEKSEEVREVILPVTNKNPKDKNSKEKRIQIIEDELRFLRQALEVVNNKTSQGGAPAPAYFPDIFSNGIRVSQNTNKIDFVGGNISLTEDKVRVQFNGGGGSSTNYVEEYVTTQNQQTYTLRSTPNGDVAI